MQNKKLMLTALAVLMATVISGCDESNSLSSSNNNSTSNVIINEVTEAIWRENLTIENNNFTMKCETTNDGVKSEEHTYVTNDKIMMEAKTTGNANVTMLFVKSDTGCYQYTLQSSGEWKKDNYPEEAFSTNMVNLCVFTTFKDEYSKFQYISSSKYYELDSYTFETGEGENKVHSDFSNIKIGFEDGKLNFVGFSLTVVYSFATTSGTYTIDNFGSTTIDMPTNIK